MEVVFLSLDEKTEYWQVITAALEQRILALSPAKPLCPSQRTIFSDLFSAVLLQKPHQSHGQ